MMVSTFCRGAFKGRLLKLHSLPWLEDTDSEGIGGIPDFVRSARAHEASHGYLVLLRRDEGLRIQILDHFSGME
jgi:hypothetical protein